MRHIKNIFNYNTAKLSCKKKSPPKIYNINYKHLTKFERIRIELVNKLAYSTIYIRKSIGVHHSTVAKELSKNCLNYDVQNQKLTIASPVKRRNQKENTLMNLQIKFKIFYYRPDHQNKFLIILIVK